MDHYFSFLQDNCDSKFSTDLLALEHLSWSVLAQRSHYITGFFQSMKRYRQLTGQYNDIRGCTQ